MSVTPKTLHAFVALFVSVVCALLLVQLTGFISTDYKKMYPADPKGPHAQIQALCEGKLSIADDPSKIMLDYVYHNGKVQQIWGLGVPLLQAPFVCLLGIPGRAILFLFIVFVGVFVYWQARKLFTCEGRYAEFKRALCCVFSVCTVFFLPAAISLMRTRFLVYEETIYWGYLYAVCLFFVSTWYIQTKRAALMAGFLSGFAVMIRPTLIFYGLATMVILIFRHASWRTRRIIAMGFIIMLSLTLITNHVRFGSYSEFGHTINLSYDDTVNTYQLKFDYEYKNESLDDAAQELFGMLFFAEPTFRGPYLPNKFPLQSDMLRWRSAYSFTYNIAYIILGIFVLVCLVYMYKAKLKHRKDMLLACAWIAIPFTSLCGFYLYSPSIASRYMMDFGAVFAITGMLTLACAIKVNSKKVLLPCLAAATVIVIWMQGVHADLAKRPLSDNRTLSHAAIGTRHNLSQLSDTYNKGSMLRSFSRFNGSGWRSEDGTASSSVILFFNNPHNIGVTVAGECAYLDDTIEMRIGMSIISYMRQYTEGQERVYEFTIPEKYHHHVWPVFIKLLPTEKAAESTDSCRLIKVENFKN